MSDLLDQLSIIVAYREAGPERQRIFDWTVARYQAILPEAELIVGEMTSGDEWFCLAECRNNGADKTSRPYLLFADADAIAFRESISIALYLACGGAPWVIAYDNYHHLTPRSTERVLATPPGGELMQLETSASYPNSNSGLVMISRSNFERSGRFDERFKGWGAEDQAWAAAATTLVGQPDRVLVTDLYHLYHSRTPALTTENPHYAASAALWDRYKQAAGDPTAMQYLVMEHAR